MAPGVLHCILLGITFVSSFYVSPIKVSLSSAQVLSPSPVPRFLCPRHKACHHSYGFDTGSYDRCLMPSGPYRTLSRYIFSAASCPLGRIGLYRVLFFRCLMPSGPYRTLSRFSAASCPLGHIGLYRVRVFRCLMPAGPYRTLSRDPPSLCRLPNFTHDHVKRAE
jgi:hypothetical protein